jgi:CheY-like chemotaxis protein/anti-sigma regulatory factor (Ser/Thr protein kinase)
MEAIGTLAGGIAHDFNNILAAINGYTELARMILRDNPDVREHLGAVLQAASRATDLVRQILAFSRQEPAERRPIHLRPDVAESLKLLRATIPSTIEFDMSLATDAPMVLADATQIHQILMNLGTNAWHAMKDRTSRLHVTLEKCVLDETHAATQPGLRPGVYARVSVGDTGCGMDQATLGRIFEPSFTTKPPGEGTGLGLAVVHGIMDNHDGSLTVYSQPGEGTVFHLYFPAHAGEATGVAAEEGPVSRGHGERVLFVDDEEVLVRLGQKTLAALGYEVEVATQPAAALAMVRADPQRFALVLTDLTMPGMTGLVLATRLLQVRPGLPIVLMTGYSASLTSERVEAAGIRQLLLKPTSIHSLGAAAHAALSAQPRH